MPTGSRQPDVPLGSLRLGERLGSGGEGEVLAVLNRKKTVFKRYFRPSVNAQSLRALADFPGSLAADDRDALLRQSAWPLACVTDGVAAVGFLMSRVPGRFTGKTNAGTKLRELQYLLYPPKPMWGEITPLDPRGRVQIAQAFVSLIRTLHGHSIVFSDISMRNLLWSPGNPAQIFVIDCDSAQLPGYQPVMARPVQTPDWDDPKMPPSGPDLDTDRYKVALVVGRLLAGDPAARPGQPLSPLPGIPENISRLLGQCFADAAGSHGTRPHLSRWAQVLSGREMITVVPPAPLPPPPQLGQADIDRRGPRESIQLPPFGNSP